MSTNNLTPNLDSTMDVLEMSPDELPVLYTKVHSILLIKHISR